MAAPAFFIRRMDTSGYTKTSAIPAAQLALIGFIYVNSGEVLADIDGSPYLCQSGQLLLIPQQTPFAISFYRDAVGYTGGFSPSVLLDTRPLQYLTAPIHQGFWFEEGAFMGLLFEMLASSYEKGDRVFIEKALDLLLSRIKVEHRASTHPAVTRFLEYLFEPSRLPGTIACYADEIWISENYLSRLVKKNTGRSVGAWIDIVRIQRSKKLLATTTQPIIDIALEVGIEDQSYFARLFKKETGLTPSAFRKKMKGSCP
ncbi:MAG: helix-turn-helix domain-containing protein [Bacteroidales bacterium]|nr:helix-turn-helix domain-containing protein [Bacteroidales bacterium]